MKFTCPFLSSQQEAEAEYQRKLKEALDRPTIDRVHPMRIMGTALKKESR